MENKTKQVIRRGNVVIARPMLSKTETVGVAMSRYGAQSWNVLTSDGRIFVYHKKILTVLARSNGKL